MFKRKRSAQMILPRRSRPIWNSKPMSSRVKA
jgi:hypothetical protein